MPQATQTENKLKCPVCKQVVSHDSQFKLYYGNGMYYFDSQEHKEAFEKEPEKYAEFEPTTTSGGSCD